MTRKEFEIKSQQCRPMMLRVAYAILADREEAADAVQDAIAEAVARARISRNGIESVGIFQYCSTQCGYGYIWAQVQIGSKL